MSKASKHQIKIKPPSKCQTVRRKKALRISCRVNAKKHQK